MNSFKKQFKDLYKFYNKELKKCHEINFKNLNNNLDYFITYIRFMRDYYILTENVYDPIQNQKIYYLCLAVQEYDAYYNCIYDYYNISKNMVEIKDKTKTKAEVDEEYRAEMNKHINNFWLIVKDNIEGWLSSDEIKI
jgi:hypothetical protein